MSHPPSMPDTPPAEPTTCTCGYDLAGLPVDDAAKCPECGAVVAEIDSVVRRRRKWWVLLLWFCSPGLSVLLFGPLGFVLYSIPAHPAVFAVMGWTVILFTAAMSVVAGFEIAWRSEGHVPDWLHIGFLCAVVPASFAVNLALVFVLSAVVAMGF